MPFFSRSLLRWGAITVVCASFAACSSTNGSGGLLAALTPYRVSVVQGNVVTREQLEVLRPGMSKIQVR
ncbi:MAG: outer membrane protein assembly factor BamE, partial [Hylemonella sp.]|nr:outer membrane protein assembly factor BamE [Hylemonella sp.]